MRQTTKYGEPKRKFNGKYFRLKETVTAKYTAEKRKKDLKRYGYHVRVTMYYGGYKIWVRSTPITKEKKRNMWK